MSKGRSLLQTLPQLPKRPSLKALFPLPQRQPLSALAGFAQGPYGAARRGRK